MSDPVGDWRVCLDRAERYADPWGNRLDAGIQPTVAALWALGFPTRWSCEGHLDGRWPGPWVTVALDRTHDSLPLEYLRVRGGEARLLLQELIDAYRFAFEPLRAETTLIVGPEVYRSLGRRFVDCAHMLRSAGAHPGSRLERPAELAMFRQEMGRFTDFLMSLPDTEQPAAASSILRRGA